jgi:ABC-type branched-subunit amino acid transport system substrate-binding protein
VTTGSARPGNVPGVTDTTVKLGVEYISAAGYGAFANAAGVKAVGDTDQLAAYKAVVAEVNRTGGVAGGRKIVIVPRERAISENNSQAAQRTCAAFTEDDRVLVANGYFAQDSPMVPCLASRGVLSVASGYVEAGSQRDFTRFGGRYMAPAVVDTTTAARAYVDALVRQGFLTPKSTVGLLWFDFADFVAAREAGLLPALKRHGITLKREYRATYKGDPAELGQIASQMQAASLRFASDRVDRVLTLDFNGTLQFFFMQNAENQGYRPKYGLASWSDAEFLRANSSATQLSGSTGIGWLPSYDADQQHQPLDPAKKRCLAIMKSADMPPIEAQGDRILQYQACATVLYVASLLNKATDLTPAGLAAAAASLGQQPSYAGFSDSYARDKLWGGAAYRDLDFGGTCSCFTYRSANRAF